MLRCVSRILAPAVVLAAVLTLAAPAYAATWTAKIGSTTTGVGTYTAVNSNAIQVKETVTGQTVSCNTVNARGNVPHLGVNLPSPNLLTETSGSWISCSYALPYSITQIGTWTFTASSYSTPTVSGSLTGVSLHVTVSGCSYDVTGSVAASFANSTQHLTMLVPGATGNLLTVTNASGCSGLANNGDSVLMLGTLIVSAKTGTGIAGPLTITTP